MEAVIEKPAVKPWVKPDHELSKEEFDELLATFDYDSWLAEFDENGEGDPIYDRFGNPSRDTIAAMYEEEHGLLEGPFTVEELFAEFDKWRDEVENEAG